MNSALHLLGIARKAGRVEIGEEPVAAAVRAGHGRLVLVASDAAGNSVRRAARFAESSGAPWVQTPFSKAELGQAVGRASCAMLAFTLSLDDFTISYFTTSPLVQNLSTLIYSSARKGIEPSLNALSALMFVALLVLLIIVNRRTAESK